MAVNTPEPHKKTLKETKMVVLLFIVIHLVIFFTLFQGHTSVIVFQIMTTLPFVQQIV